MISSSDFLQEHKIICTEALENLRQWYPLSLRHTFPDLEDCHQKLKEVSTRKTYLGS